MAADTTILLLWLLDVPHRFPALFELPAHWHYRLMLNTKKGERNMSFINCTIIDKETVICDNETYKATDLLTYEDKEFWIYLGIYVGLVLFAGW